MDVRVFLETQGGCDYRQVLALARIVEEGGLDGVFCADHYMPTGPVNGNGLGPLDVWTTLAGLSRDTERITIGSLMSVATFRPPVQLAVIAAQVDAMSGGRLMLGMGAGWFEPAHRLLGVPFSPLGERFGRLGEELEILTGIWQSPEDFEYSGRYYQIEAIPVLPRPVQPSGVPIIVGGTGRKTTPNLASRFASEYNVPLATVPQAKDLFGRLDASCTETGRDRASISTSLMLDFAIGRTQQEAQRRAERWGSTVEELSQTGIAGTADQAIEALALWHNELRPDRVYLRIADIADVEHLELFVTDVLPAVQVRGVR